MIHPFTFIRKNLCAVCTASLIIFVIASTASARPGARVKANKSGVLSIATFDLVNKKTGNYRAKKLYFLIVPRSRPIELKISGKNTSFTDSARVTVTGKVLRANLFKVSSFSVLDSASVAASSTPALSLAIIRINTTNGSPACNFQTLERKMWGSPLSVRTLYEAASFGKMSFTSDFNNDGVSDIFDASLSYASPADCNSNYYKMGSDAETALSRRGIPITSYQKRVFVLPGNMNCSFAGVSQGGKAFLNGYVDYCNDNQMEDDILAHEIGHTFVMNHAGLDANADGSYDGAGEVEYGDWSCIMGRANRGYRHFNIVHKVQMGWLNAVAPFAGTGDYTLAADEASNPPPGSTQVIRLPKSVGLEYFISYREKLDNFTSNYQDAYADRTSIHTGYVSVGMSGLVTTLGDGETYTDTAIGLSVTQLSHGNGAAQIRVAMPCVKGTPNISLAPQTVGTNDPSSQVTANVTVSNTDLMGCTPTNFDLNSSGGSGVNSSAAPGQISVPAGASVNAQIKLSLTGNPVDGSYPFSVRASTSGRSDLNVSGTLVLDRIAPPAVTGLSASAAKRGLVNIKWTAVPGLGNLYKVYRDQNLLGETVSSSYADAAVPSGAHVYMVQVKDIGGNLSPPATVNYNGSSGHGHK